MCRNIVIQHYYQWCRHAESETRYMECGRLNCTLSRNHQKNAHDCARNCWKILQASEATSVNHEADTMCGACNEKVRRAMMFR